MARKCADCPLIVAGNLCAACKRKRQIAKGTTTQRGYGATWQKLSAYVIQRDGGICQLRLPVCTTTATTADHITPKARGGSDSLDNLQAACRQCNAAKCDR
jgi:5-methylcytosine-specific restriction enzyme A